MKRCIAILLALLLLSACGAGARPADPEPESGSSSIPEPASSEPAPEPEPFSASEELSEPEEPSGPETDFEAVPPDPGTGIPALSPDALVRQQCEAMAEYLEGRLDPWDYTDISSFSGDGSSIEISAPSPDKAEELVKGILENYTGVIVPINYYPALFSIGQLDQANNDLERFFEEHPEIEEARWAPIPVNNGYRIFIKEANDKVTAFVNGYSVPDIYEVAVGDPLLPD